MAENRKNEEENSRSTQTVIDSSSQPPSHENLAISTLEIEEALKINEIIFGVNEKYGSLRSWMNKLEYENGKIYLEKDKGFLFIYHRELENNQKSEHIWLAGVVPTARNQGIMNSLFKRAIREMILPIVTIRTGPSFPNMENWVQKLGFSSRSHNEEDGSTFYEIPLSELKNRFQM